MKLVSEVTLHWRYAHLPLAYVQCGGAHAWRTGTHRRYLYMVLAKSTLMKSPYLREVGSAGQLTLGFSCSRRAMGRNDE